MKDEKRKSVFLRSSKQSQEKIKFRGFWEEQCNCACAKRLLHMCKTSDAWSLRMRLFFNVKFEENLTSEIAHC